MRPYDPIAHALSINRRSFLTKSAYGLGSAAFAMLAAKSGFGDLYAEFWFGNDFIHRITNEGPVVLRVELSDFDNVVVVAEYSTFRFGLPIAEAFHFQFGVIWAIVVAQGVGQLLNMV